MNDTPIEAVAVAFTEAVVAHSNKNRIPSPIDRDRLRELTSSHDMRIARDGEGGWRTSA
jgi:hypothetical protein